MVINEIQQILRRFPEFYVDFKFEIVIIPELQTKNNEQPHIISKTSVTKTVFKNNWLHQKYIDHYEKWNNSTLRL